MAKEKRKKHVKGKADLSLSRQKTLRKVRVLRRAVGVANYKVRAIQEEINAAMVELGKEKRKTQVALLLAKNAWMSQTKSLIGLMNKAGKSRIHHGGMELKLSTTKAKDKITVRQVQAKKK